MKFSNIGLDLCLLNATVLREHEIDQAYRHEWEGFHSSLVESNFF